jgi:hypothetical protein
MVRGGFGVEEREIEDAVLKYLARHPRAADTARGIASRWLPQQRRASDRKRIQQVLLRMVAGGRLQSVPLPDGELLYVAQAPAPPPVQD